MAFPNIFALQDLRWNNAGTTFRGIWLDLQNGSGGAAVGAAASRSLRLSNNGTDIFGIDLTGKSIGPDSASGSTQIAYSFASDPTSGLYRNSTVGYQGIIQGGQKIVSILSSTGIIMMSSMGFGWSSTSAGNQASETTTPDTILIRPAAATFQLGNVDAAAPVAQKLQVQNVVAGTSNTAGVNTTIIGSLSTGSGASGDIIFQTGGTGAGATTQNIPATSLTLKGATQLGLFSGAFGTSAPNTQSGTSYTMVQSDGSIIFTNAAAVTVTLLAASSNTGRWLNIKQTGAGAVSSASSNVVPLAGGAAGTAITTAAGKYSKLQSDGTNWIIMEAN